MTLLRLAAAAALLPIGLTRADAFDWNNSAGGAFESATNWSPATPGAGPAAGDIARFTLPGSYAVSFSSNPTTAQLQLTNGSVEFSSGSNATYLIDGAASISNTFSLSSMTLSSDVLGIDGAITLNPGAVLRTRYNNDLTTPSLSISATSRVNIASGANLLASASLQPDVAFLTGNTRVDLAGEIQMPTGVTNIGGLLNLNAPSGDTAVINAKEINFSFGSVKISGDALLRATVQVFSLASSIDVAANAHLTVQAPFLRNFASSNSIIRVFAGSRLDVSGTVDSRAPFQVIGGAELHFTEGYGNGVGGAPQQSAVFEFNEGGTTHIYRGTGGAFFNEAEVVTHVNPNLPTVVYFNLPFVNHGLVTNPAPSQMYFEGFVSGSGTLAGGGDFFIQANMSPGDSTGAGLINVIGKLTFGPAAELYMELAGRTRGTEYDAINFNGNLNLNGTLRVVPIFGFKPVVGDSFDLLDFTSISGSFQQLVLPPVSGGRWDTSDLYTTGVVRLVNVPEPGIILGCAALALLAGRRNRR